jgi:hypothetical protein
MNPAENNMLPDVTPGPITFLFFYLSFLLFFFLKISVCDDPKNGMDYMKWKCNQPE